MQSLLSLLTFATASVFHASAQTITEVAVASNFTILVEALQAAELDTVLGDANAEYTVFAPTDDAFAALLEELSVTKEELLALPTLNDILLYHVVSGKVMKDTVLTLDGKSVETVQGQTVAVSVSGQAVVLTDATGRQSDVTATDVPASNGVIHIIDTVLLPETRSILEVAIENADFNTLVAALEATGLNETMNAPTGTFTVFAPTDAGFNVLIDDLDTTSEGLLNSSDLSNIVLFHVLDSIVRSDVVLTLNGQSVATMRGQEVKVMVDGGNVTLTDPTGRDAAVTGTDIQCSNGVIHVIDTALLSQEKSITEVAAEAGFSTLSAALTEVGLDTTLGNEDNDPVTVLAPTNEAFEAALAELGVTVPELLALPNLADLLSYHVIPARLTSTDVVAADGTLVMTLAGQDVAVSVDSDDVMLTDAKAREVSVTQVDIQASNGIIHVIDRVLLVQEQSITDLANATADLSTLFTALQTAGLDKVLNDDAADPKLTVLAPTNAAFEALLEELDLTVEELLGLDTLEQILKYHVIPARLTSTQVVAAAGTSVATLQGQDVAISVDSGAVILTDAKARMSTVTATDIQASNGIIHLIDEVILPEITMSPSVSPTAASMPTASPVDGDSSASSVLCQTLAFLVSAVLVLNL